MAKEKKLVEAITSMEEDFAQWYTDVVKKAELIDYSAVKGCMIIKPDGYAIWENIQHELDRRAKFSKKITMPWTTTKIWIQRSLICLLPMTRITPSPFHIFTGLLAFSTTKQPLMPKPYQAGTACGTLPMRMKSSWKIPSVIRLPLH